MTVEEAKKAFTIQEDRKSNTFIFKNNTEGQNGYHVPMDKAHRSQKIAWKMVARQATLQRKAEQFAGVTGIQPKKGI